MQQVSQGRRHLGLAGSLGWSCRLVVGFWLAGVAAQVEAQPATDPDEPPATTLFAPDRQVKLDYPPVSSGAPRAGARVMVYPLKDSESRVHHSLFLPADWEPQPEGSTRKWPVIVELAGNRFPAAGCTGRVEEAALGYGVTAGKFIWVTMPFVDERRQENVLRWWGDADVTANYLVRELEQIVRTYHGDPDRLFLCGFSRGAIGVSYIGLRNERIASLWRGLITSDHFDGEREWRGTEWGSPLDTYRLEARRRLQRLGDRPILVCQNGSAEALGEFLKPQLKEEQLTLIGFGTEALLGPLPNAIAKHRHTDRWLAVPSQERNRVWEWLERQLKTVKPSPDVSREFSRSSPRAGSIANFGPTGTNAILPPLHRLTEAAGPSSASSKAASQAP